MAYRGTEAYDFSLFEPQVIEQPKKQSSNKNSKNANRSRNAYAPKKAEPQRRSAPKAAVKREAISKNVIELVDSHGVEVQRDAKTTAIPSSVKKSMAFFVCCVIMLAANLMLQTKYDTLTNEIASIESEINIVEGENVRLNAELSSLVSSDKIENYAENVLGMVKAENYQISYIDLSEGDEIVLSGDKITEDTDLAGKIKQLVAYIF